MCILAKHTNPSLLIIPLSEQELGLNDFIQNLEIPRLSNEEQATFDHVLTVQEIKNVLHAFEKNKFLVKTVSPKSSMKVSLTF